MSDGNPESASDNSNSTTNNSDEFAIQISKIAVAQICESTGFNLAQRSAVETLAHVTTRYIVELGHTATFYANLAGRTDCSEFDIVQALEDLGGSHGFASASDTHHCLVGSGVVREITQFVEFEEEIPFARPIPSFPIVRQSSNQSVSFAQSGDEPPKKYIPNWLPKFPEPHTYVQTPVWNERSKDCREDRIEKARQKRKGERSLLSLHKSLASNGPSGFVETVDGDGGKGKQVVHGNPFLAPPLAAGEKDVLEIVMPDEIVGGEKRLSVLETFEPVIKAAKSGSFEGGSSEGKELPTRRPTVHFKFGAEKKLVRLPVSSRDGDRKSDSWFLRDDEKDEKKRRAGIILKEAMENPQDLTHL